MIDDKTLSGIYDRHHRELYVYICGFTHMPEAAEDLLHDTFVRFIHYTRKNSVEPGGIRAFLYRTARNLCIDRARRNRRLRFSPLTEDLVPDDTGSMEEDLHYRELRQKVDSLIESRDAVSRSIYLMRTELAMPYQEIAEVLTISERTAKRKMSAMLEYLADSLEKSGFKLVMIILLALLAVLIVLYK